MRDQEPGIRNQVSGKKHNVLAIRLFLVSCLFFLSSCFLYAQSVSAALDRGKILLGEQITLELKADNINTQSAPISSWFLLPDTINHLEVMNRSPIDTIKINGTTSFIQTVTLTSFDSGTWQLPALYIKLQNSANDSFFTAAIPIQVLPVDVSALQQYHEMKDIVDVEVKPNYILIAGIVLLVLLLAAAVYFLFFKKIKTIKPTLKPVAARSLFETAMEQLEKLEKENPPAPQFYTKLDGICRTFIQNQLYIRALQLTGDELMVQLNVYILPEARTSFYQLLRLVSAVKFAKYVPEDSQKSADIATTKAAIQHIYYHLQRSLQQHAS